VLFIIPNGRDAGGVWVEGERKGGREGGREEGGREKGRRRK
jgi:hypothetical protein